MIKAMYDVFIGFSQAPINLMIVLGVFMSCICFLCLVYILASWMYGTPVPGWTSLMALFSFFFGLQFFLISIMGEYLFRIYGETLRRPLYFVSEEM